MRASLRSTHIRKLAKVGKDKDAWAKADEYLTELMESDTILNLENTDEAIKRAQNFMQRRDEQNASSDQRAAFSSSVSTSSDEDPQVAALRAELKAKDQRLAALEAKVDRFSGGSPPPDQPGTKRFRGGTGKSAPPTCNHCNARGHLEADCWKKKRDELDAKIKKAETARASRAPTAAEKKAYKAGLVANKEAAAAHQAAAAGDDYSTSPRTSHPPIANINKKQTTTTKKQLFGVYRAR